MYDIADVCILIVTGKSIRISQKVTFITYDKYFLTLKKMQEIHSITKENRNQIVITEDYFCV